MNSSVAADRTSIRLAVLLVGALIMSRALAQDNAGLVAGGAAEFGSPPSFVQSAEPVASRVATAKVALATPSTSRDWAARNGIYFKRNWGVEIVNIKPVTSGYMLAFRYKILDAEKAKSLNDMKSRAYLIDEATGIRLAVPAMEKVGELRSGSTPEVGRIYFMVFGNPGKLVKSGSRVTLVVGNFRADDLIVN